MGAYLQTPVRDKVSEDNNDGRLRYGASCMQGWRISQEDAHTCLLDFDKDSGTSMFAVYDGHGGAEVAEYTASHLPAYLRNVSAYKESNLGQALEDSFLGFDSTLVSDDVIAVLKDLAQTEPDEDENEEEQAQETAMLFEEASMPLEKLLERYSSSNKTLRAMRKKEDFQSPAIKAKTDSEKDKISQEADCVNEGDHEKGLLDNVKGKLDSQLINGNTSEATAHAPDTEQYTKSGLVGKADSTEMSDKDMVGQVVTDSLEVGKKPKNNAEVPSSTSNGVNKVTAESPQSEVSSSTEAGRADIKPEASSAGASSSGVSCSSDTAGDPSGNSAEAGGSCTSSSGSSAGTAGSSSSETAGGSTTEAGGCSSISGSSQAAEAGSSTGRTHKPRKNIIPGEDEDETSCSEDEEEEDDEDEWVTSDEEEEDIDSLVQPDSEDDDVIEGAPCVHAHAHDEDEDEDTMVTAGEEPGMDSGCTAVVAILRGNDLYVANAGDSRCVLCRDGKAVDMSVDHKPEDEIERNRIRKAGGKITVDGRVNGGLNLSRAIGDHSYKQKKNLSDREQMITALPDIRTMTLDETDEFMVLACDGIWNVMSSQDVVTFVRERLQAGMTKLSLICEEMFDFCMAPDTMGDGTGCDNMTCIIVTFNHKRQEAVPLAEAAQQEKRPADPTSDGDLPEPDTKRQRSDDD